MSPPKPDRRIVRTRLALQKALVELSVEKGYDQTSIQDVANRADVSRSTFYAHYADKEDLLAASVDNLKTGLTHRWKENLAMGAGRGSLSFVGPLLRHVGEGRPIWSAFSSGKGSVVMDKAFRQMIGELAFKDLRLSEMGQPEAVATTAFFVGSFMAILSAWMDGDLKGNADKIEDLFKALVLPGLASIRSSARSLS